MNKIIAPELSYRVVQICRSVGDYMEVTYRIVNEDGETIREFCEDESKIAYDTWWSFLTEQERQLWEDYQMELDVMEEIVIEKYRERLIGNC